ncbi:MAG: HAD family hydrolase [Candidatus Micrarchaeia archaeon]
MNNHNTLLLGKRVWLFDFDGVLVPAPNEDDHTRFVSNAIKLIVELKGISRKDSTKMYNDITKKNKVNLHEFFKNNFPEMDGKLIMKKIFGEYNKKYESMKPDSNIIEIIKSLSENGIRIGIFTNNTQDTVCRTVKRLGYLKHFERIIAYEQLFPFLKPEEFSYKIAAEHFNASSKEIVFVDDSEENVRVSKRLGIVSIHVSETDADDKVTDFNVRNSEELLKLIRTKT